MSITEQCYTGFYGCFSGLSSGLSSASKCLQDTVQGTRNRLADRTREGWSGCGTCLSSLINGIQRHAASLKTVAKECLIETGRFARICGEGAGRGSLFLVNQIYRMPMAIQHFKKAYVVSSISQMAVGILEGIKGTLTAAASLEAGWQLTLKDSSLRSLLNANSESELIPSTNQLIIASLATSLCLNISSLISIAMMKINPENINNNLALRRITNQRQASQIEVLHQKDVDIQPTLSRLFAGATISLLMDSALIGILNAGKDPYLVFGGFGLNTAQKITQSLSLKNRLCKMIAKNDLSRIASPSPDNAQSPTSQERSLNSPTFREQNEEWRFHPIHLIERMDSFSSDSPSSDLEAPLRTHTPLAGILSEYARMQGSGLIEMDPMPMAEKLET